MPAKRTNRETMSSKEKIEKNVFNLKKCQPKEIIEKQCLQPEK
jgi:hypothetical protein